ncbi:MAG: energy transducer TonB [Bernardetiaceae bacterium]
MQIVRKVFLGLSVLVLAGGVVSLLARRSLEQSEGLLSNIPGIMPFLMFFALMFVLVQLFSFILDRSGQSILEKGSEETWTKKYYDVDVNKYTNLLFNIGLAISLGATLMAFEWRSYDESDLKDLGALEAELEEMEEIPITEQPPPPPPPKQIQTPEIIEVPDEEEIEEEIEVDLEVEVDQDMVIEEVVQVEEEEKEEETNEVFMAHQLEKQAEPPGGISEFLKYVYQNVEYPKDARRAGIEGRVFITFVVEKDGSLTDMKSMKPLGYGLDEEVIRVIGTYPHKWSPAKQRGRPARQRFQVPIKFKLQR